MSKYQGFDPPEAHLCGGSNNRRQALRGHEAIVEEAVVEEAAAAEAPSASNYSGATGRGSPH